MVKNNDDWKRVIDKPTAKNFDYAIQALVNREQINLGGEKEDAYQQGSALYKKLTYDQLPNQLSVEDLAKASVGAFSRFYKNGLQRILDRMQKLSEHEAGNPNFSRFADIISFFQQPQIQSILKQDGPSTDLPPFS